jgi:hypothetical protein
MDLTLKLITAVRNRATTLACNACDERCRTDYWGLTAEEIAHAASDAYERFVSFQDDELQCLFRPTDVRLAFIETWEEQYLEQQLHNAHAARYVDSTGTTRMVNV